MKTDEETDEATTHPAGHHPMKFTDLFIRRPVLASVVSLLILVVGLRAIGVLPVLQYPRTENAVVTVTTT
jgi:multidrug efflux pump